MAQLIMRWKNDSTPVEPLAFPEGFSVVTLQDYVQRWDVIFSAIKEAK